MQANALPISPNRLSVSINPATGQEIGRFPHLCDDEVEQAVANVHAGYLAWRNESHSQHSDVLNALGDQLELKVEQLARQISLEMGKPLAAARAEITKSINLCRWYSTNLGKLLEEELPDVQPDGRATVSYRPLGVILGVMPWNFPVWQVMRAAVPIMAAGNGFLLKHADNVQGCAAILAECFSRAGLKAFASLNIDHGTVAQLIADPRIVGVTVTSGTSAGSAVAGVAGKYLKKSVLELGGSDPFIVLADADLDRAVEAAVNARFQNSGQVCIAAKRIIVQRTIVDSFVERFVACASKLKIGDPLQPETQLGPLARGRVRDELHAQVVQSLKMGAKCLLGGKIPEGPGNFYPPTVLTNVTRDMPVFMEETFGPVAAIIVADDASHAVEIANDSSFGLSGAIWTGSASGAEKLALQMETGAVFINGVSASDPRVPIGGIKNSGYGRELSHFGIREFCNAQLRWTRS